MSDVLCFIDGSVGRIRLNRPKAIHALNTAMCAAILDALAAWRDDPAVGVVTIDHAEGRGFCAGGDIRMLAESGAKDGAEARDFFFTEYRMNHRLFTYEKPVVAFMDGITMGGGVGISQPARYRVATENTRFAMPETGIGLFPDVGGGWYLSRLPGRIGQYLALTGARLDGAECLALGLATHYLPAAALDEAKARIADGPGAVLDALSVAPGEAAILSHRADIDRLFAADTLADILAALEDSSRLVWMLVKDNASVAGFDGPVHAAFIRAPLVVEVRPAARALATLPGGGVVAVRQGNLVATAFHPEVSGETRFHELFLQLVRAAR